MNNFFYVPPYCPEHPKEQLKTENLIIKTKDNEIIPFQMAHYCPQSKKYLNKDKELVSREESALEVANERSFFKTNPEKIYKLSDIEVITFEEYTKIHNTNL